VGRRTSLLDRESSSADPFFLCGIIIVATVESDKNFALYIGDQSI
jgi:hypothetical protein